MYHHLNGANFGASFNGGSSFQGRGKKRFVEMCVLLPELLLNQFSAAMCMGFLRPSGRGRKKKNDEGEVSNKHGLKIINNLNPWFNNVTYG